MRHLSSTLEATLAALLIGCGGPPAVEPLADTLPRLDADHFDASIRERVRTAYELVKADPDDAAKNGDLAMLMHAHNQYEHAETFYRRAQRREPSALNWTYYLGFVQQRQGQHEDAAANFRAALKIDSSYGPARLRLADSLLALGQLDESGELYESVIDANSGIAEAHYGLGRVLTAKGDLGAAIKPLERACELGPRFGAAHYALALAYRDLGQSEKAWQHLARYKQDPFGGPAPPDPLLEEVTALQAGAYVYLRRGIDFEKAGRMAEAVAEHEKALELDPDLVRARMNLVILYGRIHNFEKANEHYQAARKAGASHAELHYNFGVLAVESNRVREAKAAFTEALKLNPHYSIAHNNLGFLLEAEGRRGEAERHYRLAIENQPDYRLARFHLGRLLAGQGRLQEAIAEFRQTLEPVDEQTPQFLYALAAAHDVLGDRAQTVEYARRAQELAVEMGQPQLARKIERDLKVAVVARDP
jgi:tetratricopeptide (TPR) repeat protein